MKRFEEAMPKWQKEMMSFKGIKSTFIIEGNINDLYPSAISDGADSPECVEFDSLNRTIANIFDSNETRGCYDFLFCDSLLGFSDPLNFNRTADIVARCEKQADEYSAYIKSLNGAEKQEAHSNNKTIKTSEIIRAAITQAAPSGDDCEEEKSIAVVVNYAGHYIASPESLSVDETAFFSNLLYASTNARRGRCVNSLILVVDKFNDIPSWFYLNNPNIRTISIPNPDRTIREMYINRYFSIYADTNLPETEKTRNKLIDLTDGMRLRELDELRRLYKKETELRKTQGSSEFLFTEIPALVSVIKYGYKDNPWERIACKLDTDVKKQIEKRVIGQEQAVDKVVRVMKRAVSGLSGMQHSSESSKPRGILFLAGPTGTGKTELVKTIAELLFGDERSLIRFDMSEYSSEHSDQKLFGAPPGYVGYDAGGQLTNAIKNNPFSVLLFDEIEKAHPSIMDKFLQVLEDGRLTDGQGNTVYFSETLIFFTSNVGISREIVDPATGRVIGRESIVNPGEEYADIQRKVEDAMETYFKPEVINRIGENIVVFNYISEEASKMIVRSKIDKINSNIMSKKKVEILLSDSAYKRLYALCMEPKARANGGRGIGNVLEENYLNPLSEFMFDMHCRAGSSITADEGDGKIAFQMEAAGNV